MSCAGMSRPRLCWALGVLWHRWRRRSEMCGNSGHNPKAFLTLCFLWFCILSKPTVTTYSLSSSWLIPAMTSAEKGVKSLIFSLFSLHFSDLDMQIPHLRYQNSLVLRIFGCFHLFFDQIANVFVGEGSVLKTPGTAQSDKAQPCRICVPAQTLHGLPLIFVAWQNPAIRCWAPKPHLFELSVNTQQREQLLKGNRQAPAPFVACLQV